jgi:hypothetical protein
MIYTNYFIICVLIVINKKIRNIKLSIYEKYKSISSRTWETLQTAKIIVGSSFLTDSSTQGDLGKGSESTGLAIFFVSPDRFDKFAEPALWLWEA